MTSRSHRKDDDDLDDLDHLLHEFNPTSSLPLPDDVDFPDPDEQSLPTTINDNDNDDDDDEELDDEAFARELQQGMQELIGQLGGDDAADLQKMMENMLKGGGLDESLTGTGGGGVDEAFLAALTGAAVVGSKQSPGTSSSLLPSTSAASPPPRPAVPAPPANFQDTIAQAMNKIHVSGTTVDAETERKSAAAGLDDPLMAAMLSQLGGLEGLDLEGGGGIQGVLDEMMEQLMSRELLYAPLKELSSKVDPFSFCHFVCF